ncbi:uncharacterized protein G2W53_031746 [Senna tora]|uniref:Phospholipase-like protein n=1 Tax=Senna tora TaxID=362788 RepID=A0A834W5Q6_9FABA|nr:uncharacterized protein G2W53_031746 [Senna tora]
MEREMAQDGKINPNCVYASNPYHECSDTCSRKIKEGKPHKNKKSSGYRKNVRDGEVGKKTNEDKRRNSSCPKASNPYHECGDHCNKGISAPDSGFASTSSANKFVRRKKPEPPVLDSVPASKIGAIYLSDVSSPISHYSEKNGTEIESNKNTSPKPLSGEVLPQEIMPAYHKDMPKVFSKQLASPKLTIQEEKNGSPKVFPITYVDDTGGLTTPNGESSMDSSNRHTNEDSDDEEDTASVISECRVSVGRYHVKESYAPILKSIFDKYGDIGASCHLESVAMRSYYVECVCFVVQELQASLTMELTKSKLKELLAILKDVESAQVQVAWLHSILEEITENVELINQRQVVEMAKANCDHEAQTLRKKLELDLESLAQKEQEIAAINTQIANTKDRLKELELKSSALEKSMVSIKSKVDRLDSKSLLDELL